MATIRQLSDDLIRQIAAGEVIAEPLSVVKEAIENSIDAGATSIQVEIKNGGMTSIVIADNGSGIQREDLEVITTRHSTSKIQTEADLQQVLSLGFRGEFLASLLAAADLTIITKPEKGNQAYKASFSINHSPVIEPAARPQGTTLHVANLFEKIPARRSFLPKPKTSVARIHELLRQFSLAYSTIVFSLRSDNQDLFRSQPGSKMNAITLIFGVKVAKNLIHISGSSEDRTWTIEGFISKPSEVRATRSSQYFFVNGRIIENTILQKAVEDGYKNWLAPRRFPIVILYFRTNPEEFDANVHPAKKEIRIKAEQLVYQFVMSLVYETLMQTADQGSVETVLRQRSLTKQINNQEKTGRTQQASIPDTQQQLPPQQEEDSLMTGNGSNEVEFDHETVDEFETEDSEVEDDQHPLYDELERFYDRTETQMGDEYFVHVINKQELLDLQSVAQIEKTFIIATSNKRPEDLYLIDQHAVSERLVLESMVFSRKKLVKQTLLEPLLILVTPEEKQLLTEIAGIMSRFGYIIELGSTLEVKITAVPLYPGRKLSQTQLEFNFREILSDSLKLQGTEAALSNQEDEVMKSIACHTSIRAGDILSKAEMNLLLKNMVEATFPFVCCHGRPSIFKMKTNKLHKLFWRA